MPFDPTAEYEVEASSNARFDPTAQFEVVPRFNPKLRFGVEEPPTALADFMAQEPVKPSVASSLTSAMPTPAGPALVTTGNERGAVDPSVLESAVRQEPAAAEAEIQPIGEPGTFLRGASSVVAGVANRPELLVAMANPATAAAVAARYTPEVAKQFLEDLGAATQGDNEALGRAAAVGLPVVVVGGAAAMKRGVEGVARVVESAKVAERAAVPGGLEGIEPAPLATETAPAEFTTGTAPESVRFGKEKSVKRARPVEVPSTPAEAMRDVSVVEEIRAAGADTTAKVKKLYPHLSNEQAAVLRRAAYPQGARVENVLPKAAATLEAVKDRAAAQAAERSNASEISKATEVHGDVLRGMEEGRKGTSEVPKQEGEQGVRAQEEVAGTSSKPPIDFVPDDLRAEARADLAAEPGDETVAAPKAASVAEPASEPAPVPPPTPPSMEGLEGGAIIGMGGAVPGEFKPSPDTPTSIKNAVVEKERAARGLPPAIEPARRTFGRVWDEAMAKVDADPEVTDKLLASLREKPRAATDLEDALLLHRQIDLQNDYGKATRELAQAIDDGRFEDAGVQKARVAELSDKLLDLYNIEKKVGTETGRGLAARRMLANSDFTLASMTTERRAAKGGKRLTDKEVKEVEEAHQQITSAVAEVEAANKTAGTVKLPAGKEPKAVVDAEFKLDKAKRKWREKLADDAEKEASIPEKLVRRVGEGWNDIRAILTSLDLSAVLRQGKLVVLSRPTIAARALPSMFRALGSEKAAFAVDRQILARPNATSGLYDRAGLYLAEHGQALSKMEEAYMARLADKIPGVAASQRAYTTFLNRLRADTFDAITATLERGGEPVTTAEAKVVANYVNAATGRGDMGKFNAAAVPMATVFFAPRFITSRFQILLGQPLYHGVLSGKVGFIEGARARRAVATEYTRILTGIGVMYALGNLAGASVELDPRSSDFGKMKFGNTRVDPMAGLIQATVFLSRELSGSTKNTRGVVTPLRGKVPYGAPTAVDVGTKFLRGKLAPAPGAIVDVLQGKDVVGQPVTPTGEAEKLLVPITYQDVLETMEEQGVPRGVAMTLLSIFGEGVQTYDARRKQQ